MTAPYIPDLVPLRFELLSNDAQSIAFAFSAKKIAMGPHIHAKWGWDEAYQFQTHASRFNEKPFFAIRRTLESLGTVSWLVREDYARLGEFYLFDQFQGAGLGTKILRHLLAQADALRLPVRLEYLKWNPVGNLYLRNGFVPTHETDIHIFLERPVQG
jgi:GNAT superfamily N-acetyltransferase